LSDIFSHLLHAIPPATASFPPSPATSSGEPLQVGNGTLDEEVDEGGGDEHSGQKAQVVDDIPEGGREGRREGGRKMSLLMPFHWPAGHGANAERKRRREGGKEGGREGGRYQMVE